MSFYLSTTTTTTVTPFTSSGSKIPTVYSSFNNSNRSTTRTTTSVESVCFRRSLVFPPISLIHSKRRQSGKRNSHVICMAPDEDKLTQRNPLDFPVKASSRFNSSSLAWVTDVELIFCFLAVKVNLP
ncbi:hypothetical protein ACFE04_018150 [Oxalis oulophora]